MKYKQLYFQIKKYISSIDDKLIKNVYTVDNSEKYPFLSSAIISKMNLFKQIDEINLMKKYENTEKMEKKRKFESLPLEFLNKTYKNEVEDNKSFSEFLIAGKSNVGKSSLINSLLNKKIVLTSKTPGKTNTLSFINNSRLNFSIVDSPGYGFANRPDKEIKLWEKMMQDYISKSNNIKHFFLLIDSEHGVSELDEGMLKLASFKEIPISIIFTKCDKLLLNNDTYKLRIAEVKKSMIIGKTLSNFIFFASVKSCSGLNELIAFIIFNI